MPQRARPARPGHPGFTGSASDAAAVRLGQVPTELACHVRDVYRVFAQRVALMLAEDDPLFASWDQDATALAQRYHERPPQQVADELAEAGRGLADAFAAVDGDAWARTGRRSDGASFTVDTLACYLLHDPAHHLWDVRGASQPHSAGS